MGGGRLGAATLALTNPAAPRTLSPMHGLPPSCPPLPEMPPLFWNRVHEQVAFWQGVMAQPQQPGDYTPEQMRKMCLARIKTRLKRIDDNKNPGRALFELADYLACLMVLESRN